MKVEMKKNTLYKLITEDVYTTKEGEKVPFKDIIIGYVRDDDNFFFGSVFTYDDNGQLTGGDTMYLTKERFNEIVKSVEEIKV